MRPKISVVITNFNGLKLLQKNLESVLINTPEASEFIFADDASTDSSLEFVGEIQKIYPKIKIIKEPTNLGFVRNSNTAVAATSGNLIVLLNNDICVFPGYLQKSLCHFSDPKVFGVGFAEISSPNWARLFWRHGYLQHEPITTATQAHISGWLSGGSSIVRKSLFQKLGGFDQIYSPFYCEDLDLGFRAWRSGYTLLWEPSSLVGHRHESTISKFPRHFLTYVKERNRLLTVWRNISTSTLLRQHRLALISRVIFGPNYLKIIFAAKRQLQKFPPPIVFPIHSDLDVFKLFSHD